MIEEKDILESGKIYKPHGLKGEMNAMLDYDIKILEDDIPIIMEVDGIYVPFYLESFRPKGHFACLIKFEGVNSKEETRPFVNQTIYFRRKDIANYLGCSEDEIIIEHDLIGFEVFEDRHGYIGTIEEIDDSTQNCLMVIRKNENDEPIYIPFADEYITFIEDDEKKIGVNVPDELLHLNAK